MKPRLIDQPGRARTALIVPVGLFGGGMLALAWATGKLRYLVERLPEPKLNGFPLLCLAVVAGGCLWRLSRIETPAHEFDELAARRRRPVSDERWDATWPDIPVDVPAGPGRHRDKWPLDDPGVGPWFGTSAARLVDPDPDAALPTLLPDGRPRS